jgi:hypothetical protein
MNDLYTIMIACNTLAIACNCVGFFLAAEWIRRGEK